MALESRPRARANDGVERLSVRVALYGSAVHDQLHRRGVGRVARDVERARRAYRSEAGELRLRPIRVDLRSGWQQDRAVGAAELARSQKALQPLRNRFLVCNLALPYHQNFPS